MKKVMMAVLVLAFLTPVVASPILTPAVRAFELPKECVWAWYAPQYVTPCIVYLCMEMGLDLEDYL
jgi:hypothetical protein